MNLFLLFLPILLARFLTLYFPLDMEWYSSLKKSPYTPPGFLFGVVWFGLYLSIGWGMSLGNADWLILNLALNYLWLIVFNGYKNIQAGFWILLLMGFTLTMHLQKTKQWFLLPYLGWSLFALYLNGYIMKSNLAMTGPPLFAQQYPIYESQQSN